MLMYVTVALSPYSTSAVAYELQTGSVFVLSREIAACAPERSGHPKRAAPSYFRCRGTGRGRISRPMPWRSSLIAGAERSSPRMTSPANAPARRRRRLLRCMACSGTRPSQDRRLAKHVRVPAGPHPGILEPARLPLQRRQARRRAISTPAPCTPWPGRPRTRWSRAEARFLSSALCTGCCRWTRRSSPTTTPGRTRAPSPWRNCAPRRSGWAWPTRPRSFCSPRASAV